MRRYDDAAALVECVMCSRLVPWGAAFRVALAGGARRFWLCEVCYVCWTIQDKEAG